VIEAVASAGSFLDGGRLEAHAARGDRALSLERAEQETAAIQRVFGEAQSSCSRGCARSA
jgi:hypothetical protein